MNDLDDRLHRASEAARSAVSDLRVPPLERVQRRARRIRAVRAFAGAAVVLLAVLGATAVLRGGTAPAPPADATTTTTSVDDWARGRVVLSEEPRVVQAALPPETAGLEANSEFILLPIDALTANDLAAIGPYSGDEPVVAVGANPVTGERLFVIPPGWSGAPAVSGVCYVTVGGESTPGAFCDDDLTEPLIDDVDPSGSIRLIGPVPEGTAIFSVTAEGSGGRSGAWQRPRGGYVFIDVATTLPAVVTWEARSAGGTLLATRRLDGIGAGAPSCSAAGLPLPSAQSGLPTSVAELRRNIVRAASECDYAALAALAADGFTSSFGGTGIELLAEREAEGDPLLATLVEILDLPYAEKTYEDGTTYYYWPRAFAYDSWDQVPEADRDALRPLYGDEDFAAFADFGGYIGWRAGITADGEWVFFVAGD